ncbi:hypothetical protein [Fulvivirga kasyanovii]|uniref:Uncharacterized protein n=1 Tax=Fulvivirga kasyanovii TaxID=396812 RepID=A0ABW9RUT9_9BACT|nr:hypothetical protein [Fulvivirga kasyanovii]MTI27968.1 hypothetical protein [Fulvivirga kasyanovii]
MADLHPHIKSKANGLILLALLVTMVTGALSPVQGYTEQKPKATSGWVVSAHNENSQCVSLFAAGHLHTAVCSTPALPHSFKGYLAAYNRQILIKQAFFNTSPAFLKLTYTLPLKTIPQNSDEEDPFLRG